VFKPANAVIIEAAEPALLALNESLRDSYIADCERGLMRWNKIIREAGVDAELRLPHRGFNRAIGQFGGVNVTPEGRLVSAQEWQGQKSQWLPTKADLEFVASLMKPEFAPGKFSSWIAPPARGINHQPIEFPYVLESP
jgi:benzoyl-CoA 2,3-dioxygenase component B